MDNIEDDEGLDDSNIDLLHEKANRSDEDGNGGMKHDELVMERAASSDSDDQFSKSDNGRNPFMKVESGHDQYLKDDRSDDQYTKLSGQYLKVSSDEQPIMQKKLFGPPCWNPEQLAAAIECVKNGTSVTGAARQFGIPRTTLSNKIYGRRRRLLDSSSVNGSGVKRPASQVSTLIYVIGSGNEKMVADMITAQKGVDSFSATRAVFDVVKYLANEKGHVLKDDEEVKEWIQYFFFRQPNAYFPITLFELRSAHMDDEYFADYVFETSKAESAEDVLKKLITAITRRLIEEKKVMANLHLFWWYTFLCTFPDVRDYFLDNMTWPDTILNSAVLEMAEDRSVYQILTSSLLKRNNRVVPFSELKRPKLISNENSESPTQVAARRTEMSMNQMYENVHRAANSFRSSIEDGAGQDSSNIGLASKPSFGKMLAQEALSVIERKVSNEELRYFKYRYGNPHLEEAYQVWKNLKVASDKDDVESIEYYVRGGSTQNSV